MSPSYPLDDKWREWRLDELGEPTNTTRLDANTRRHGLMPRLNGDANATLTGAGTWGNGLSHFLLMGA